MGEGWDVAGQWGTCTHEALGPSAVLENSVKTLTICKWHNLQPYANGAPCGRAHLQAVKGTWEYEQEMKHNAVESS